MKIPLHTAIQLQKQRVEESQDKRTKEAHETILRCMQKALYSTMIQQLIIEQNRKD